MGLPFSSRLMPGPSAMSVICCCPNPELISLVAPERRMTATSFEPDNSSAWRKPAAMDNTAMSTSVTPAIPTTATSDEAQRSGMLRTFIAVTAPICEKVLAILTSTAPQRVGDLQAHRRHRGPQARDHAQPDH